MYKIKESKRLARTALVASLLALGSAQAAITYYNFTGVDAVDGTPSGGIAKTETISGGGFSDDAGTLNVNPLSAVFTTTLNTTIVGTGVIDPFVRIHADNTNHLNLYTNAQPNNGANCANNGEKCVELGYNTNGETGGSKLDLQFQEADSQGSNWNHTLALADMKKTCDAQGQNCTYSFILDINERNNAGTDPDKFLSLDQFRIFSSNSAELEGYSCNGAITSTSADTAANGAYNPQSCTLDGAKAIYDMDMAADGSLDDKSIGLNYALNSGSGNGVDLVVTVSADLFRGDYVYLFSSFGEVGINSDLGGGKGSVTAKLPAGDFSQSDGFEEWATVRGTPIAPTLVLFGIGLAAVGGIRKLQAAPRPA